MTEEDVRRIVREELAKQPLQPIDYRGHSPLMNLSHPPMMACACGPNQCARLQTSGVPCTNYRPRDW